MSRKSVSVIIVTRDEGVYRRRTVHSLHQGLAAGDEILVVDDQSTDGSTDTLRECYAGVCVLRPEQRLGVRAGEITARSTGAAMSWCSAMPT
jgi:glycosyltransferase involved in cell wall biosynthesis